LRILAALNSRTVVIVSTLGLIILGFYFYVTSNNYSPTFSDIQPPSNSSCALDFISQVDCLTNHSSGSKKISIGVDSMRAQHQEWANYAVKNGTALERSGNLKEAIKYYDKALLLQPINSDLLVTKGDALSQIGNYTGAIIYYDKVLDLQPNSTGSTGIIESIGNDLYRLGKYKEAIRSYDKALSIQPNNPDLLINKGNALFHIANYSGAIKYYDKGLASQPNSATTNTTSVIINKALALFHIGNYSGAVRYYDKVLTMAPNDVQVRQAKMLAVIALQKSANSTK
jgi:tetratricopeptide (TPR) repeat protein